MTNEEMFNKNVNIAYKIANRYLINYRLEYEDIKQIALMGLWKSILTFDGEHAFSTYAYVVIQNEINHYLRNVKKNTVKITSLETELADGFTVGDTIQDSNDEIGKIEQIMDEGRASEALMQEVYKLKPRDRQIYQYIIEGYTQCEIANRIGTNQTQVSRIRKRIIEKTKKRISL